MRLALGGRDAIDLVRQVEDCRAAPMSVAQWQETARDLAKAVRAAAETEAP